jgi:pimeloyl-ACP methyl ester carboxylesterase
MQRALILASALGLATAVQAGAAGVPQGETVHFKTEDGIALTGTYFAPKEDHAPGALLVHDAGADRGQLGDLAVTLNKQGFGVVSIDLRGHGESRSENLDWTKLDEAGQRSLWQLAPKDVDAGAKWLLERKEILPTNLSLVGYRSGCALVARHAERDENVVSLTLLAPKPQDFGFDVQGTLQRVTGLPTCVLDKKSDEVERMVIEANGNNANPWVRFEPLNPKSPSLLDDRKTTTKVGKFLEETALPKRGRG